MVMKFSLPVGRDHFPQYFNLHKWISTTLTEFFFCYDCRKNMADINFMYG